MQASSTENQVLSPSPARLMFQSAASAGARFTAAVALLLTVSLAARKMSSEEFGLWSILLSFMFVATAFDLGFRYGLSNRMAALVARSGGRSDPEHLNVFLSVFVLQIAVATCGAVVCMLGFPHLPWTSLFNIRHAYLAAHVSSIMPVVGTLLFLYLPFSLWGSAFYAHQEVTLVSVLSGAQSLALLAVFALAVFTMPFHQVVLVYFAAYVLTGVLMTAILFLRRSWVPRRVKWTEQVCHIRSISRPSLGFFVLSLSGALTVSAGVFFSGAVTGLKEAGDFSLIQKIFGLLLSLHLALLAPLAPAYTRHAELGDWDWVRRKLSMTIRWIWPLVFVGGGILFVALHPLIIRVWAGKWLSDFTLAGLLALWAIASGWANTYAVLLNSLGLVRFQGIVYLVLVVPVVALPLILGRWWGIHGVALASLICVLPTAILWPPYVARALREKRLLV